jgi:hypothetical protein
MFAMEMCFIPMKLFPKHKNLFSVGIIMKCIYLKDHAVPRAWIKGNVVQI